MTIFDQLFFSIFSKYKIKHKQKANTIALYYVSFLQSSLLFAIGSFILVFFTKMRSKIISPENALLLFILISFGIHSKNWIKYNGKTRKVLNAKANKKKTPHYSIYFLWALPFICIAFGIILQQAL